MTSRTTFAPVLARVARGNRQRGRQWGQPTRVVAWVGKCWHASAHKRCPVCRRRAPVMSTVAEADDPCGRHPATWVIRLATLCRRARSREEVQAAPNSRSLTALPGANRSGVARGRGATPLQQRQGLRSSRSRRPARARVGPASGKPWVWPWSSAGRRVCCPCTRGSVNRTRNVRCALCAGA